MKKQRSQCPPREASANSETKRLRDTIQESDLRKAKFLFLNLRSKLYCCEGKSNQKYAETSELHNLRGSVKLSAWEQLILKTAEQEFELAGYIFFAMKRLVSCCREVFPSMLLSESLFEEYKKLHHNFDEGERIAWESQEKLFRVKVAQYSNVEEFALNMTEQQQKQFVLLQCDAQFSALFLFVQAVTYDMYEICQKCHKDALLQYSCHPVVYDAIFNERKLDTERIIATLSELEKNYRL